MPTKRAYYVLMFALLLLIGAWVSKLFWVYMAFSVSVALMIASFVLSRLLIVNLDIKRHLAARAYEDDMVTVVIEMRNRVPFFDQSLEIEDNFSADTPQRQKKSIFINGIFRGKMKFSYQSRCYKRGKYNIGPFRIRIYEPFGLFYLSRTMDLYSPLVVYPQLFDVRKIPFMLGHLAPRYGEQTTRISGNYEEFYGIREYKQEDGWRRIHWRSTARLNELTVRHFEQSSQWKTVFVLDSAAGNNVGHGKDTTFEYGIKVVGSMMKHLLDRKATFGFIASTDKPIQIGLSKGKDHYHKIMDNLAVIEPDGSVPINKFIPRYEWMIPDSCSLVVVTNDFSQALIKYLRYLRIEKNIGVIPVVLNSDSFLLEGRHMDIMLKGKSVAIRKAFQEFSSQTYVINCRDDLKVNFIK